MSLTTAASRFPGTFAEYEKALGLESVFTSYCNPRGGADIERVLHTLKKNLL
ncbi:MAG: hypothetical protein J6X49_20070 [Victivallales bacterium]|nr:hypothetical protein [Victivallales bacterium]